MKVLRIYVDTSVLGGCFDAEFAPWSNGLIEDFRAGRFRHLLSDVTAAEVEQAPETVRALHAELVAMNPDLLTVTPEVISLLSSYEAHGILESRFRSDMLHVALATIADADLLVSWNFRHIVRLDKIRLFGAVNVERGYRTLSIYSRREVTTFGQDEDDTSG